MKKMNNEQFIVLFTVYCTVVSDVESHDPRLFPPSVSALSQFTHCEKSLFVLASRQKIPVLRTENPAVDTRTICLLPIEFF
jgi:hypothetical protein